MQDLVIVTQITIHFVRRNTKLSARTIVCCRQSNSTYYRRLQTQDVCESATPLRLIQSFRRRSSELLLQLLRLLHTESERYSS